MMELYEAYRDYRYLMDYTESLIRHVAIAATGSTTVSYQGFAIDLGKPFARPQKETAITNLLLHDPLTPLALRSLASYS